MNYRKLITKRAEWESTTGFDAGEFENPLFTRQEASVLRKNGFKGGNVGNEFSLFKRKTSFKHPEISSAAIYKALSPDDYGYGKDNEKIEVPEGGMKIHIYIVKASTNGKHIEIEIKATYDGNIWDGDRFSGNDEHYTEKESIPVSSSVEDVLAKCNEMLEGVIKQLSSSIAQIKSIIVAELSPVDFPPDREVFELRKTEPSAEEKAKLERELMEIDEDINRSND